MRNTIKFCFLPLLVIAFSMSACMTNYKVREAAMQEWLAGAKRPVKVTKHHPNQHLGATRGSHYYTLIDSEGRVFLAQNVRFELPEVIE
ncbi:MAG TPA: hypothetical protein PKL15_03850 [Saprospiraceae bacterium]|nr:hypothetical protein [Saprospiraceae bacterium]HNL39032.1 hypothetical protein [Saprospiraceae bacterium]HNM24534.1 hypothetical protein [Saprospiraceae bacterium]